ncbi:MAG: HAD family phosphatase [Balneolaceae bacterium]
MKEIKTVIFDMDGVIINSEPVHMKVEQEIFCELGLNISEQEHLTYVGRSGMDMMSVIFEKYQLGEKPEKVLSDIRSRYLNYLKEGDEIKPVENVLEIIRYLHEENKQLLLASSATREEIKWVLNKLNLNKYFAFTISGAELENSKPHPAIFNKAAELSETHPAQCCVIEDSKNGVIAAKAAGMKCIGFRNPHSGNQDLSKADVIIADFKKADIVKVLANLADAADADS